MSTKSNDEKRNQLKTWLLAQDGRLEQLAEYTKYSKKYIYQLSNYSINIPNYTWRQIELAMRELDLVKRIKA